MFPIILNTDNEDVKKQFLDSIIAEGGYISYFIFTIEPLKSEISIDQIRALKKEIVSATPHKRLFIIHAFDTASLEAQNALLKTLEEKNEQNQFILMVRDIGRVLPTIQSRSKIIHPPRKNELQNSVKEVQQLLTSVEDNSNYAFLQQTASMNKEDAVALFDSIIVTLDKDLTKGKVSSAVLLKKALQQKNLLLSNNLNPQLAVDAYLLYYKKIQKNRLS